MEHSQESSSLDVDGLVYATTSSCACANILVVYFLCTTDLGCCTPVFLLKNDDEPTSMMTTSCLIGTTINGESFPLELFTAIGSLGILDKFPRGHNVAPQPHPAW